jgi:hypothetical protein
MLIQLGANQREELKGEVRVVAHDRLRQELRERMS